ncbi:MAG: hypothetical protein JO147_13355 [Actinobacteria bacterium]|nr:hypothetical protein [Actinomycetota bacterium]
MLKTWKALAASAAVATLSVLGFASAPSAGAAQLPSYTCTGGDIPSGNYASLTVTGACDVPDKGMVNVTGNVYVAPHAILDAQTAPSTITVGGNVIAASGSLLGLGCQPDLSYARHPCMVDPTGSSTVTIKGNVIATGADTVLINGTTVDGNVILAGGGGENPWSVKNNTIRGNLTITGVTSEFMVILRNTIGGNVTLVNITETDTDPHPAVEIVVNKIGGNLICIHLLPRAAGGFITGQVNTVGGKSIGQCANLVSGP